MDIKVVPLQYHEQMRLAEKFAHPGMGRSWWLDTLHAASVREIDGVVVPRPSLNVHVRDILRRLGDDGLAFVEAEHLKFRAPGDPPEVVTKRLSALERWDLKLMAGERYDIPAWANLAYLGCMVRSVDGQALAFPDSLDALYERVKVLGVHGIGAAARSLNPAAAEDADG